MATILLVEDNPSLATVLSDVLAERGHRVEVYRSSSSALMRAAAGPADAAVVDLLLGDRRGLEVIEALAAADVAAVAMSGMFHRGQRFSRQAALQAGARAHFDRPFDLAVVVTALERLLPARVADPYAFEVTLAVDEAASATEPAVIDLDPDDPCIETIPAGALAPPATPALLSLPVLPGVLADSRLDAGNLSDNAVLSLLRDARRVRTTGELRLRRGDVNKAIRLRRGRPISAISSLPGERLGGWAVASGLVPASELDRVLDVAAQERLRIGEAMVRLGLLAPDNLLAVLSHQSSHIVSSTLEWPDGEYEIHTLDDEGHRGHPLHISVPDLVHDRVRRMTLGDLRGLLPPGDRLATHADSAFELDEIRLDNVQARLLAAADGTKTVEDLLRLSDLHEHEGLALLVALRELNMLAPYTPRATQRIVLV